MDDYPKLVFHGHGVEKDNIGPRWIFGPKDVIILACIAFTVSGLMGLGSIVVVELIDSMWHLG